jgi:hypothetical protein
MAAETLPSAQGHFFLQRVFFAKARSQRPCAAKDDRRMHPQASLADQSRQGFGVSEQAVDTIKNAIDHGPRLSLRRRRLEVID